MGRRLASSRLEHTLLPKVLALPVFSSDALSSVAYATEQILIVLSVGGIASRNSRPSFEEGVGGWVRSVQSVRPNP